MLHQIRKMIGLAIAIMRGFTDSSTITRAFGPERIDIPIAPGLGLLLEEVHYERYNKKYGGDGIHEALLWDEVNEQIVSFKSEHIYPRMVETEIQEKSMLNWLSTLPIHTFSNRDHESLSDFQNLIRTNMRNPTNTDEETETESTLQNEETENGAVPEKDCEQDNDFESKTKKLKVES